MKAKTRVSRAGERPATVLGNSRFLCAPSCLSIFIFGFPTTASVHKLILGESDLTMTVLRKSFPPVWEKQEKELLK